MPPTNFQTPSTKCKQPGHLVEVFLGTISMLDSPAQGRSAKSWFHSATEFALIAAYVTTSQGCWFQRIFQISVVYNLLQYSFFFIIEGSRNCDTFGPCRDLAFQVVNLAVSKDNMLPNSNSVRKLLQDKFCPVPTMDSIIFDPFSWKDPCGIHPSMRWKQRARPEKQKSGNAGYSLAVSRHVRCHLYTGGSGCAQEAGPSPSHSSLGMGGDSWEEAGQHVAGEGTFPSVTVVHAVKLQQAT